MSSFADDGPTPRMHSSKATMFIVSAPSGAGKTSLVRRAIAELDDLAVSVSHTTRERRPGDEDGSDYHFVSRETFESMIAADRFLEYAEVFGNYYGTSVEAVEACIGAGQDVILEIDWQGAEQVRQKLDDVVSIFVLPPSRATLTERLRGRGQDSDAVIATRTEKAVLEMQQYHRADYLIINDAFEQALTELKAVVLARRVAKARQALRHAGLITSLTH